MTLEDGDASLERLFNPKERLVQLEGLPVDVAKRRAGSVGLTPVIVDLPGEEIVGFTMAAYSNRAVLDVLNGAVRRAYRT